MFKFVRYGHLQDTLNPPLHEKYSTGVYYWRTETLCTSESPNKSVCQARLNTKASLCCLQKPAQGCRRLSDAWCRITGRVGLAHGRITETVLYFWIFQLSLSFGIL
jgi:hypothetical protein